MTVEARVEPQATSGGAQSASTGTDGGANAPADSNYTRSYEVEADTPVAGVKRLTVTVTGLRSRQVQLKTLITQ